MLITLNNGNTVEISFEQYDKMSDQEYKYFMDSEYGEQINDPFYHSQIDDGSKNGSSSDDDLMDFDE